MIPGYTELLVVVESWLVRPIKRSEVGDVARESGNW